MFEFSRAQVVNVAAASESFGPTKGQARGRPLHTHTKVLRDWLHHHHHHHGRELYDNYHKQLTITIMCA